MNGDASHFETDAAHGNDPSGKVKHSASSGVGAKGGAMVGYQGLAARLDEFLRRKELDYKATHQQVPDGDEYFFSVTGLPDDWDETKEVELGVNAKYSVHRHPKGGGFTVTFCPKGELANLTKGKSYEITFLTLRRDGSVQDYQEASSAAALKGSGFRIHVSPGYKLCDAEPGLLPPDAEKREVIERATGVVNELIQGGTLIAMTKAAPLGAARWR